MISKLSKYKIFVVCLILLSCDAISEDEVTKDYPVFIPLLTGSELIELNEKYHDENNGLICSTLNEFGFTGFSRVLFENGENPCLSREIVRSELLYSDVLMEQAKNALVKNSEFTNVYEVYDLNLKDVISLQGCTICEGPDINNVPLEWKFSFSPQTVNDVLVSDSEIVVYVGHKGVNRIWGNWWPVKDPGFVDYGSNYAIESVIGMNLSYTNNEGQVVQQEVSKEDIAGEPKLRFEIIRVEDGGEIHKVWQISILKKNSTEIGWLISLSTVSGNVIETKTM